MIFMMMINNFFLLKRRIIKTSAFTITALPTILHSVWNNTNRDVRIYVIYTRDDVIDTRDDVINTRDDVTQPHQYLTCHVGQLHRRGVGEAVIDRLYHFRELLNEKHLYN